MVYLDNASSSFPKPEAVLQAVSFALNHYGSPTRTQSPLPLSGSVDAIRKRIARFFGAQECIFASSGSDALNTLIQGMTPSKSHILCTQMAHNSVLRPLHHLQKSRSLKVEILPPLQNPADIEPHLQANTHLVILNHASNVNGSVIAIDAIADILRQKAPQAFLGVDASQSVGLMPIDMDAMGIDLLACAGHKSLYGPMGMGLLLLGKREIPIQSSRYGGTGVDSASALQPQAFPFRLEVGTLNIPGIMGLAAGIDWVESQGMQQLYQQTSDRAQMLRDGMQGIADIQFFPAFGKDPIPLVSFRHRRFPAEDIGAILAENGVACRSGLHCAPLMHQFLGSTPQGTVRLSPGPHTSFADIQGVLDILDTLLTG